MFGACPGGVFCNVLSMLTKLNKKAAFPGKVGNDQFGKLLKTTIEEVEIESGGLLMDEFFLFCKVFLAFFIVLGYRSIYGRLADVIIILDKEEDMQVIWKSKPAKR